METQLKASEEDNQRLRMEREHLRDRLSEMQMKLKEKEAEVSVKSEAYLGSVVVLTDEAQVSNICCRRHCSSLAEVTNTFSICVCACAWCVDRAGAGSGV